MYAIGGVSARDEVSVQHIPDRLFLSCYLQRLRKRLAPITGDVTLYCPSASAKNCSIMPFIMDAAGADTSKQCSWMCQSCKRVRRPGGGSRGSVHHSQRREAGEDSNRSFPEPLILVSFCEMSPGILLRRSNFRRPEASHLRTGTTQRRGSGRPAPPAPQHASWSGFFGPATHTPVQVPEKENETRSAREKDPTARIVSQRRGREG